MNSLPDLSRYDPAAPATQQNPYPWYAALRREAPVFYHEASGLYMVSTMKAVMQVLAKPTLFSSAASRASTPVSPAIGAELKAIQEGGLPNVPTMLTADPPAQTRYRKSIGKPFAPGRTRKLEPVVRRIATNLIEAWPRDGVVDFLEVFAMPLPIRAISHVLVMPEELSASIKRWSDDSVAALGAAISDARRLEAARGVVESQHYWARRYQAARSGTEDDFVTNLVNADFQDHSGTIRKLEVAEFVSMMRQFMVAGNETTTKLFSEALRLLIANPVEWQRIREDPARIPAMVEEAFRLASPNQGMFRTVLEATELEGVALPAGARLWIIFGSANRDETVFPDPDRLDPSRENLRDHLAFGRGTHVCPGAPLSRLEAVVGFEELVRNFESFSFAEGYVPQYEPSFILRGLRSLEVVAKRI